MLKLALKLDICKKACSVIDMQVSNLVYPEDCLKCQVI